MFMAPLCGWDKIKRHADIGLVHQPQRFAIRVDFGKLPRSPIAIWVG
jgi:hypothetical protein